MVFMDNSDTRKARRPLPTPGLSVPQRPNTSVLSPSPIGAAASHSSQNDMVPDPFPSTEAHWADDTSQAAKISPAHENWRKSASGSDTNWDSGGGNTGTAAGFESMGYMTSNRIDHEFIIDGRSTHEETHWWNPELRERNKRPGPGVLAPVLAEELHASNCSLFSVKVTVPSIAPLPPVPNSKDRVAVPPTPSSSRLQYPIDHSPPTEEEVMASVPHPNAYYCPKDNGWVILSWNSSIAPPLARSYIASRNPHFPDEARRRRVASCIEVGNRPFGKTNMTHHFHKYEKAVDSDKLTPSLRKDKWESLETVEQRRSVGNLHYDDSNIEADDVETLGDNDVESSEEEGKLLDLYVCCQCSFYCVVSGVIPGVIPRRYLEELVRDKNGRPVVGMSAEQSIAVAVKAFLTAIENKLWKGNNGRIKLRSTALLKNLGWNANIERIFELLGFVEELTGYDGSTLKPPVTDLTFPEGQQNRHKLLRAWLEIASWRTDFKRIHGTHFTHVVDETRPYVQLYSAREMYQTAIGAHPDQISRGGLSNSMLNTVRPLEVAWRGLGLTPTTYSADLLGFSYLAQCRCDPAGTPQYFTYLTTIVQQLQEFGSCPPQLQELLAMERSRERFTSEDIATAATTLGFGIGNVLNVEYKEDVEDQLVENAWKEGIKRSWRDLEHGSETFRLVDEAFRILAESRGSIELRKVFENRRNKYMTPDQADDTLGVAKDVDDSMLITVYNMRLDETPSQLDKLQDTLTVIAEIRDSERLRSFLYNPEYAIYPPATPQPQQPVTSPLNFDSYIPYPTVTQRPPLMEQGPQHLATQAPLMPGFILDEHGMLIAVYELDALDQ